MNSKGFSRGQTQVLFRYLPEAIFEHDDYGLCKVTRVALGDAEVNREALFDAMAEALATWTTPGFATKFPDPRDPSRRAYYAVGAPREVRFTPYPQTFTCRGCSRTARYSDLLRRGTAITGRCTCGGVMKQQRYVQAHNCGRLEELYLPTQSCPKGHGPEHLAFYDPGRVKQARWYCGLCSGDIQALRMTPCKCAYNESLPSGQRAEKFLRVVPTGDPSLYVPHTVAFINFPQDVEGRIKAAPDALALMLARSWGLLDDTVGNTLRERERFDKRSGDNQTVVMVEELRRLDPRNKLVVEYDSMKSRPKGQDAIDRVDRLLTHSKAALGGTPPRWLIEHTTLLDKTNISTAEDVASMLRRRGDEAGALDVENALRKARELMGISEIRVVNDFPLALCAYGYTRTSRDPGRTIITPFPVDERGKIPVFSISSDTEALWFQLDPKCVVAWLIANGLAAGKPPAANEDGWAWLYAKIPGLREPPHQPAYQQREAVAIRTLLHTLSHVFLRRIEWSGFSPSSIGEYLIPASLSYILYANRYAETKIGGLTTLFEQRLNTWLWDAVQSGYECVYDPICSDEGGSCAGCTHREHNCVFFNRDLTRATVYGGFTPQRSALNGMLFQEAYWRQAWQAAPYA